MRSDKPACKGIGGNYKMGVIPAWFTNCGLTGCLALRELIGCVNQVYSRNFEGFVVNEYKLFIY